MTLGKISFRAEAKANGIEVLHHLDRQPYDIVLMDIRMQGMDGIEATKIILDRWPQGPKIKVVTYYDSKMRLSHGKSLLHEEGVGSRRLEHQR